MLLASLGLPFCLGVSIIPFPAPHLVSSLRAAARQGRPATLGTRFGLEWLAASATFRDENFEENVPPFDQRGPTAYGAAAFPLVEHQERYPRALDSRHWAGLKR